MSNKGKEKVYETTSNYEVGETSRKQEEVESLIFGKTKWGDLSPSSSEKEENEGDEEEGSETSVEEEEVFGDEYQEFQEGDLEHLSKIDDTGCSCLIGSNPTIFLSILEDMIDWVPTFENLNCILNNIVRSYNFIFEKHSNPYSKYRVAFVDLFYRIRHEILFKIMCFMLNISAEKSDIPFSKYGIDSIRTPDKIIERGETIIILEVTAVSSFEKAASSKGMEKMGFESKYKKEIELLKDIKSEVIYSPLFFNMSDLYNPVMADQISDLSELFTINQVYLNFINHAARNFSSISLNFKNNLGLPSAILFNDAIEVDKQHPEHEFLYVKGKPDPTKKIKYSEITISNNVYRKIYDNWDRLGNIAERKMYPPHQKMRYILDPSSHRIEVERDRHGLTLSEIDSCLSNNDKIGIFKNTYIKIGNVTTKSIDSETGVKMLERTNYQNNSAWTKVNEFGSHVPKYKKLPKYNIEKLRRKCKLFKDDNITCNYYDKDYENMIIDSILKFDTENGTLGENDKIVKQDFGSKLLGQMLLTPEIVRGEMDVIKMSYDSANRENEGIPRTILKCKSPFVIPMGNFNNSSYCKLEVKNLKFFEKLREVCLHSNPYTCLILDKASLDSYKMYTDRKVVSDDFQSLLTQRMECSSEINRLYKECKRENPELRRLKNVQGEKGEIYISLSKRFTELNRQIRKRGEIEGVGKDISYIRLPTKNKNSPFHSSYKEEMSHFKNKKIQSTTEGVGIINNIELDYKRDTEIFNILNDVLMEFRGENPDKLYDDYVSKDSLLLEDLKRASVKQYSNSKKEFESSALGHASSFISRLAHSLMFYSQQSFSSDYVRVDNLGYKNVLLMVKGGKKIFKSKTSKLFRLAIPIFDVLNKWYSPGHSDRGSQITFKYDDASFLLTPWAFLHENTLSDSISFYQRLGSFTILNLSPELSISQQFHKIQLNVILAFHNRRKTEVLLANLRYILLSTMGEYTGLQEILKEFFGFNYDCFQSFIRSSILLNYPKYFESLYNLRKSSDKKELTEHNMKDSQIKNIFTQNKIDNVEDLALMIYSTFLMTKAPYQKLVERSNNLKGILNIHDYYTKTVGDKISPKEQMNKLNIECKGDFVQYSRDLFSNDFNFDAKYCALIGNFMDSYFKNNFDKDIFHAEWIRIQNSNWDEMATSTGLRGDYNTVEDFWGQKGYFVVYKGLLKDSDFKNSLYTILNDNLDDSAKRKLLRSMNKLYKDQKQEDGNEFLIFHAVDKTQWRGNREIYVMDVHTKIFQQPIEKFMGFVCSKMDNELISIPSNKRAQVIHHSIFEKDLPLKDVMTWYLTLDCSKWAPKSVFSKFSVCINNMDIIPNSFKFHLLNYFEKLYKKRLYFNQGEVEVLKNNIQYKEICEKYLVEDTKVKGYYLEANYTWVMGIFNYMSSFLHAANQKYFSYVLSVTTRLSYNEDCDMQMFAHSDDSGGKITVSSPSLLRRALVLYEINLHAANHLVSRKKSVVSKIYFEILSVIYLFKKLLALLPKFLGGLRFLPTDKGPSQDLLQSYSKCIEVIVAGADFSISYIVLKIMSYLVYRFYFNKPPEPIDYCRPCQYVGMPDAHPIMCLLCGTDADILRLIGTAEGEHELKSQVAFVNGIIENSDGEGPIKPLKFAINIKNLNKDFGAYMEFFQDILSKWSIKNVNFHSTGMNALSFLAKLKDPGFVGALVNESQVRRISRSYHHRSSNSLVSIFGNLKLRHFIDSLKVFCEFRNSGDAIKEILKYSMPQVKIEEMNNEVEINFKKTETQIEIFKRTMKSPLKLLKYFDKLSLENRNLSNSNRTLKPALVQLNKGGQIFSVDFDPAVLVSYVKEPELKWALNNIKNINTAKIELERYVNSINKEIKDLPPDILLRICRSFGRDNVKNIYIYSRTPSDMRQIKNYTSFITFLSVNSFSGKEIEGLTINVSDKDSSKEYVTSSISETSYLINNMLSVLFLFTKKLGVEYMTEKTISPIDDLDFLGGDIFDFIEHLGLIIIDSIEGPCILLQYYLIKSLYTTGKFQVEDFRKCAYYTFLKEQKARSGWYGLGEVYINISGVFYSFKLKNNYITEACTNKLGKIDQMHEKYIMDVFESIGVEIPRAKPKFKDLKANTFGYDVSGGLGIFSTREVHRGVPCVYKDSLNEFVNNIESYQVVSINKNNVIIKDHDKQDTRKIYFLPLKKAELIDSIRLMFNPTQFKCHLDEQGMNDFEEYLSTEIMPDYGADLFVSFEQFVDNYSASKVYEVFKRCRDSGCSKINSEIEYSNVPAQEGSLTRILIDYAQETGDKIVKTFNRIDSDIMRLRSEYPDQVSVILQEKLLENYRNMYTDKEVKEVTDGYMKIMNLKDPIYKRAEIIKLMGHWGYSGLVNNLENFKLIRRPENYIYFNYKNCFEKSISTYSKLYSDIIKKVLDLMCSFSRNIDKTSYYSPEMFRLYNMEQFTQIYIKDLCYNTYKCAGFMYNDSLASIFFNNTFLCLMDDEDFTVSLQNIFSENLILSSIPVSTKFKTDILVLLNMLQYCWFRNNLSDFEINPTVRLQRFPDNIPTPPSKSKTFSESLRPSLIYYSGALSEDLISWMTQNKVIFVNDDRYAISNKIKKISRNKVPMNEVLQPVLPLNVEVFDTENWEEIISECEMGDLDEDTILELWDEIENKYQRKKTQVKRDRRGRKTTTAEISWVILPYQTNKRSKVDKLRQCGENIVVLTNNYIRGFLDLNNTGCRLIKVGKMEEPLFAFYMFQKELMNEKFIDQILSRHKTTYDKNIRERLLVHYIRDSDGLAKNARNLGRKITEDIMVGNVRFKQGEDVDTFVEKEEDQPEDVEVVEPERVSEIDPEVEKIQKIDALLKEMSERLGLSESARDSIREKYYKLIAKDFSFSMIFDSAMMEKDMMEIVKKMNEGEIDISKSQRNNIMSNPRYFSGLAKGNVNLQCPIKDKKLKSEMDSVATDSSKLVPTAQLTISPRMQKLANSNYRLWFRFMKTGNYKTENKLFLLQYFVSLTRSSKPDISNENDDFWQECMNKYTDYFAQDPLDTDDEIAEMFSRLFVTQPGARIRYRSMGAPM